MGILVSMRTAHAFFSGLVLLPVFTFRRWKIISMLVLLVLSTAMFIINMKSLQYYRAITSVWYENLITIPADPKIYKILFLPTRSEIQIILKKLMEINRFQAPMNVERIRNVNYWAPVAYEAGFKTVVYRYDEADIDVANILAALPDGEFHRNEFYRWRIAGEWLIIDIDWPRDRGNGR